MSRPHLRQTFFERAQINRDERLPYPEHRYTKYFWLVNLQNAAYTRRQSEYLVTLLQKAVLSVFTRGDVVAFGPKNHRWDRRYIGSNNLEMHIEVGPKMSRVHAHLIQEVKHRSVINIDPDDVRDAINKEISKMTGGRITKSFVSRRIHPSSKPLEEYLDKDNDKWREKGDTIHRVFYYTLVSSPTEERLRLTTEEDVDFPS